MIVRPETARDRDGSLAVERAAFGREEEVEMIRAVRDEPASFALVGEEDGEVVGHVQMSAASIGDDVVFALGPIGVRPDRQGKGVGSALVREALSEANRRGAPAVILVGSPAYYGRFGFEAAPTLGLPNPFAGEIPDEDVLVARLDEAGARLEGPMRWHPAFGQPG